MKYTADKNDRFDTIIVNKWYKWSWWSMTRGGGWSYFWPAMAWLFAWIPQAWAAKSYLFLLVTFGIIQGMFSAA